MLELLRLIFDDELVRTGVVGRVNAASWFKVNESVVWTLLLFNRLKVDDDDELERCIDFKANEDEFEWSVLPFWFESTNDRDIFEKLRSMNWFILCDTPCFLYIPSSFNSLKKKII